MDGFLSENQASRFASRAAAERPDPFQACAG